MKYVDPIGMPRKLRKACSFWLSTDEREYLKKQLEIYRARQITKEKVEEDSSTEEQRRSRAPQGDSHE